MKKYLILAVLLCITVMSGCTVVETGNVGVEKSFGKVTPDALPQGVYLTVLDSVYEVTTKEVNFQVNDLNPKSQDNLTLQDFDADIYFKVTPSMIPAVFIKYQGDYVLHADIVKGGTNVGIVGYNRILRAAREATYDAVAKFPATTMHTKRAEIAAEIQRLLQAELETSDKGAFTITSINVRNLITDKAIEAAIQNQVRLDQNILAKQKEVLVAIEEANRLREQAKGEADANEILAAGLTPSVLQIRMAEIQRDTIVQSAKAGNTIITGGVDTTMMVR